MVGGRLAKKKACFKSNSQARLVIARSAATKQSSSCPRFSHKAMKNPAVYIMANKRNGTIYIGVTSNLSRRAWEHREALVSGFTARYGCKLLAWFEFHDSMQDAITREKQIKAGSRKKKLTLIEASNPSWRDLYEDLA
jgi:putative endonuclease